MGTMPCHTLDLRLRGGDKACPCQASSPDRSVLEPACSLVAILTAVWACESGDLENTGIRKNYAPI
jgi:hypothetical protein